MIVQALHNGVPVVLFQSDTIAGVKCHSVLEGKVENWHPIEEFKIVKILPNPRRVNRWEAKPLAK